MCYSKYVIFQVTFRADHLEPLLLIWFKFNPSMDK